MSHDLFLFSKTYRGFINVDNWTFQDALEDLVTKGLVKSRDVTL
jgi:hypothetical protein